MAKMVKRSKRKKRRSSGASTDYLGAPISTPPSPEKVAGITRSKFKFPSMKSPIKFDKNLVKPLKKAFKAGSDLDKWAQTGVAIAATGLTFGVLSSATRYATYGLDSRIPASSAVKPLTSAITTNILHPDFNLILQSAGIVGSAYLVGKFADLKQANTNKVMMLAYGAAGYRLLTGLSAGDLGRRMSSLFDGRLDATLTPQASPMINTPAQANAFRSAFVKTPPPGIFPGSSNTSYAMKNPSRVKMILNNNVPWFGA